MFTLNIKDEGDRLRLIPCGEMDMYYTAQFKDEAIGAYDQYKKDVLIDCADLKYVDSTGLGGFIYLLNHMKENGHAISIEHLDPNVKKLFTITKLDKLFHIEGEN
ncbi:MAG: STAS domain-containing protein [Peptoniphilus sp.]|nr:STAS domain-containing protein [Peptoniphilus sp.]MDY3118297.1 STAS domain-containing protein [Peptoniphilus sp.]